MRWAVICLLAGCYTKPVQFALHDGPADDTSDADAPAPVDCSDVAFPATAITMSEFGGGADPTDPSLSANGLEMYFAYDPDPSGKTPYLYEIAHWTKADPNSLFAVHPTPLPFNQLNVVDSDPSLTADGSMIFFISSRSGSYLGYFATRTGTTWGVAAQIPGLETMGMISLDISADGLALYFTDTSTPARLVVATRPSRLDAFAGAKNVGGNLGNSLRYPTVSADQLELFVDTGTGVKHASRATKDDLFELAPPMFVTPGVDPDLSADGETLVLSVGSTLGTVKRICPDP